ncbi:hypothetical protein BH11ACT1_BH11ACT1_26410 [soil metagenome]
MSVREQDALAAAADELGIDQPTALALHHDYLDAPSATATATARNFSASPALKASRTETRNCVTSSSLSFDVR